MAVLLQEMKHKINENGKLKRWYFFSFFKEFECKYHCSESWDYDAAKVHVRSSFGTTAELKERLYKP